MSGASIYATVKAVNLCGHFGESPAGNGAVLSIMVPDIPAAPITAISGTDVTITWAAPADGGSPIIGYTVFIRESDGFTFSASPYNLASGASVYA